MSLSSAQTSGGSPWPTKLNVKSSHWHSKSFTKFQSIFLSLVFFTCFPVHLQPGDSNNRHSFPTSHASPHSGYSVLLAQMLSFHIYLYKAQDTLNMIIFLSVHSNLI